MKVKSAKRVGRSKNEEIRSDEEFLYQMEMSENMRGRPSSSGSQFGSSQSVRDFVGRMLSTFDPDFLHFYWHFEPYDCSLLLPEGVKKTTVLDAELQKHVRSFAMRFFQEDWQRRRREAFEWPDQSKVVISSESSASMSRREKLPDLREIFAEMKIPSETRDLLYHSSLEVKLSPRIMIRRKIGLLRLSQLSDGEQRLFSLFVDIARQLSLQNSPAVIGMGEAIVLIDEIDVHLHPKWQREIVPALEHLFQNCQFIATTHSPFIVQATPPGSVQNIDGKPIGDVTDRGIEEVAKKAMDVEGKIGVRYEEELEAASAYLKALYATDSSDSRAVKSLRSRLERLGSRYARNPAYQAFLELKTDAEFGSEN